MSRTVDLKLLSPPQLLAAAERILAHPTANVQRVAMDEVYTFAVATTQLAEVSFLAAGQMLGTATPEELARLRVHLLSLGTLPATFTLPTAKQEKTDVE